MKNVKFHHPKIDKFDTGTSNVDSLFDCVCEFAIRQQYQETVIILIDYSYKLQKLANINLTLCKNDNK